MHIWCHSLVRVTLAFTNVFPIIQLRIRCEEHRQGVSPFSGNDAHAYLTEGGRGREHAPGELASTPDGPSVTPYPGSP